MAKFEKTERYKLKFILRDIWQSEVKKFLIHLWQENVDLNLHTTDIYKTSFYQYIKRKILFGWQMATVNPSEVNTHYCLR